MAGDIVFEDIVGMEMIEFELSRGGVPRGPAKFLDDISRISRCFPALAILEMMMIARIEGAKMRRSLLTFKGFVETMVGSWRVITES